MDYPLFKEKLGQLKQRYPLKPNHNLRCENSDYGDYLASCKNCYYTFDTSHSQNLVYIFDSFKAIDCIDGDYVIESEHCYDCVDVFKVYNSAYLNYCARMYDSFFCWDCGDSNNLFGCVHLNHKQYCIFNKQYTEEEYEKKIKELLQKPIGENLQALKELAKRYPITVANNSHIENSDYGNHIDYSKNMYLCFDCAHSEDCAYGYDAHHNKNCYDQTQTFHSQNCYECFDCAHLNNCFFMRDSEYMYDSAFCEGCSNSNHLFGCVSLDKKEYCILNKQYSKAEYEKEIQTIMHSMRD